MPRGGGSVRGRGTRSSTQEMGRQRDGAAKKGPYEARRTAAASPMRIHPVSMSAPASGSGREGRTVPKVVAVGWTVTAAAVAVGERRSSVNAAPRDTAKATTAAASRIIRRRRRIIKSIPWVPTGAASGRPGAGPVPETRTSYRPVRTRLTPRSRATSSDVPRRGKTEPSEDRRSLVLARESPPRTGTGLSF
jgi:hypothetical protein